MALVAEVAAELARAEAVAAAQIAAAATPTVGALRMRRYRQRGGDQIPGWLREEVFERDQYMCCECSSTDRLEIDHVIPLMKEGPTVLENLQTLCKPCNARKRDRVRKADIRGQSRTIADKSGMSQTSADEPAPSPPPLLSPQTPQTTPPPHPHPEGITTHAKARISFLVMLAVAEACRAATPKPIAKRRWPKTMPPPPGVSDDQWAGFVAHRLAKRSPLTDRAYDLLVGKLAKSSSDEWPPGRIIDTIVERGWVSFEMEWLTKGTGASNGKLSHHDRPSAWRSGDLPAGASAASLDD